MGGLVAAHFSSVDAASWEPKRGRLARVGIATFHIPEASG